MRCLHCGKRVLLRKFSSDGFCSEAHRQLFFGDQQRLALARLVESEQHMNDAARRCDPSDCSGFLSTRPAPYPPADPPAAAPSPLLRNVVFLPPLHEPGRPERVLAALAPRLPAIVTRRISPGRMRLRAFGLASFAARIETPRCLPALRPPELRRLSALALLPPRPVASSRLAYEIVPARCVALRPPAPKLRALSPALAPVPPEVPRQLELPALCGLLAGPVQTARQTTTSRPFLITARQTLPEVERPALASTHQPRTLPLAPRLLAATGTDAHCGVFEPRGSSTAARIFAVSPFHPPSSGIGPTALSQANRLPLPASASPSGARPAPILLNSDPRTFPAFSARPGASVPARPGIGVPDSVLPLPFNRPAPASPSSFRPESEPLATSVPLETPPPDQSHPQPIRAQHLIPLPFRGRPRWQPSEILGEEAPLPCRLDPSMPRARLIPVPADGLPELPGPGEESDHRFEQARARAAHRLARPWVAKLAAVARNPRLWLSAAAALLAFYMLRPSPETTVAAASTSGDPANQALARPWQDVRQRILQRAGINLQDDFRSGLSDWRGRANWAREWRYDPAGFVRTGALALYLPSATMSDYSFEFLGQIERKSLSWVVRAQDFNNYYVFKIVIDRPGPLPAASLVHYAVIGGRETARSQVPLPLSLRKDSLFRIRVDVRGEDFTTSIHDQVVDFWSNSRLSWGGIGFFSAKGEQSRIRWIEVSHQYDMLGRLCAWMAPYGMAPAEGGLNR